MSRSQGVILSDDNHNKSEPEQSAASQAGNRRTTDILALVGKELLRTLVSVGIAVFVIVQFFYKPVVVLDLKNLVAYQKKQTSTLKAEEMETQIAEYFKSVSDKIQSNDREIILVKEAVLNSNKVLDITGRFKQASAE